MSTEQKIRLLVSSGDGPDECRIAVSHILRLMEKEAITFGVHCELALPDENRRHGPSSAIATFSGEQANDFARRWHGTIQWTCRSRLRPHHKRQNWFVGVFAMPSINDREIELKETELKYETFRAGGPGGQHQNTTDSAVRVTHIPSGVTAVSRDQRSQHRNKQMAKERLADRMAAQQALQREMTKSRQNQLHKTLERGNPVRVFAGEKFEEKSGKGR